MSALPERQVTCPTCKGPALYSPANAWRPFCSKRCRGEDLGAWASEQFRVVAPASSEELEEEAQKTAPKRAVPPAH
jgi:uncharacterized protein